jgi:HSP20 family protein
MTLFSTDSFARLLSLQRELERSLGAPMFGVEGTTSVFPPLNIFNDRDGVVIRAEVPGFKSDQISITVEPRSLVLKGERPPDTHGKPGSYHRRERQFGNFARSIALPADLDTAKATAECRHGLLTIRIPRAAAAKPKQIPIKSAA